MVDDGSSDATARRGRARRRGGRAPRRARAGPTPHATPASPPPRRRWSRSWTTTCAPRRAGSRRWSRGAERHDWAGRLRRADPGQLRGARARARAAARSRPITTLDLGDADREADFVWSANMAVRRSAIERVGGFDEERADLRRRGGVADAPARARAGGSPTWPPPASSTAAPATTPGCARSRGAEYRRGRAARRSDRRKGTTPPPRARAAQPRRRRLAHGAPRAARRA